MEHRALAEIAENGRLSIPVKQRKMLGLEKGGRVVLIVQDGELVVRPMAKVIADIQARAKVLLGENEGSLVDELFAMRREDERLFSEKYGLEP